MSRKWGLKMIYSTILFAFNLIIIIILSNVKRPTFTKLSKYKISPIMMLQNTGIILSEVDINKYHSIFVKPDTEIEDDENND